MTEFETTAGGTWRIAGNRPPEVHLGLADPTIPNFEIEKTVPTT